MRREDLIRPERGERIVPPPHVPATLRRRAGIGRGFLLCAFLLFSFSAGLIAQDSVPRRPFSRSSFPVYVGVGGGYEPGMAFGEFPVYGGGSAGCGLFGGGVSVARRGTGEIRFPDLFGGGTGLAARLNVSALAEEFTALPTGTGRVVDTGDSAPRTIEREFRFRSAYTALSFDLLFSWQAMPRLTLRAGPTFGYRFSGRFEQYDTLLGSDVFENGATRRLMPNGTQFTLRPFGVGVAAGAGYRLPVGERLSIEPDLTVRLDILGPVREMRRSVLGGALGLSFLYALGRPEQSEIFPSAAATVPPVADTPFDTAVEDRPPDVAPPRNDPDEVPEAPLAVTLDVYSLDSASVRSDTAVIPVRVFRERRFVALLPRIYFEKNRGGIPSRYPLLDSAAATVFTVDSIRRTDPERINRHLLDIVGKRLKDNPGTSVRLFGNVSVDETQELVKERTGAVAGYLQNVWGIPRERVIVSERELRSDPVDNGTREGREEQRYVEIEFMPQDLAGPVVVEQIAREFSPPGIKLSPAIDSGAVLDSWQIIIRQGEAEVARYSNSGSDGAPQGIPWNIVAGETFIPSALLVAELTARDTAGRQGRARDTLPVSFIPADSVAEPRARAVIILPGSWGSVVSEAQTKREAGRVIELLRGGERIRIYPRYSGPDRFAAERSLALARGVGEALIEGLKESGVPVAGVVIENSPDEIDSAALGTPERRVAGRGVMIVIDGK